MSTASAKDYVKKLKSDKGFAKRINACKDADARLQLAKTEGFDFSKAELMAVKSELSEADLDKVAGGGKPPCKVGTDIPI